MRTAHDYPEWAPSRRGSPHLRFAGRARTRARISRIGWAHTGPPPRAAGKSCAGQGAAQVVLRIAMAAGKLRTAQLQNGSHLSRECALGEQFPCHPKIDNAPVRLWKPLGNAPSLHQGMIDLNGFAGGDRGCGDRIVGVMGTAAVDRPRGAWRRRPRRGGRLEQAVGVDSQTGTGVQDRDPGRVASGCAARGLLVGEAGQSAQVTPVGAGQIPCVGAGQLFGDRCGQSRFQRAPTEVQPSLQMARAGLDHDAWLESMAAHGFQHRRVAASGSSRM
jgi:hypothetical protein